MKDLDKQKNDKEMTNAIGPISGTVANVPYRFTIICGKDLLISEAVKIPLPQDSVRLTWR